MRFFFFLYGFDLHVHVSRVNQKIILTKKKIKEVLLKNNQFSRSQLD